MDNFVFTHIFNARQLKQKYFLQCYPIRNIAKSVTSYLLFVYHHSGWKSKYNLKKKSQQPQKKGGRKGLRHILRDH